MDNQPDTSHLAIFEKGTHQVIQTEYDGIPIFVVPQDMKVETLRSFHEERLERPLQLRQRVDLLTAESFIEYYKRFADEHSTIFVDVDKAMFVAALDYHQDPKTPAWQRHIAVYKCPKTREWNTWIENNNNKMNQEAFAEFIEDNANEITQPDAATMFEIASSLQAKRNVDFKSSVRLDNGQTQLRFEESIDGTAGLSGQLEIPNEIELLIQPFAGGPAYKITARFRYRIIRQQLEMWYTLNRPSNSIEDAINDVFELCKKEMGQGQIIKATYQF